MNEIGFFYELYVAPMHVHDKLQDHMQPKCHNLVAADDSYR